jgi:ankyrin repeat domain-containing protein 50
VLEYVTTQRALCEEVGICFAYYDYRSPERQDLSQIIPALVKQLLRKKDTIPAGYLRIKQDSLHPSTLGNHDSFVTVAKKFEQIYLVIDGLDECPREKRHLVLGFISQLLNSLLCAKIFVTSRREQDISEAFRKLTTPIIEVKAKSVAEDIKRYVADEIKQLLEGRNGKKLYVESKALEQKIIETLTSKAEGMYVCCPRNRRPPIWSLANIQIGSSG